MNLLDVPGIRPVLLPVRLLCAGIGWLLVLTCWASLFMAANFWSIGRSDLARSALLDGLVALMLAIGPFWARCRLALPR